MDSDEPDVEHIQPNNHLLRIAIAITVLVSAGFAVIVAIIYVAVHHL